MSFKRAASAFANGVLRTSRAALVTLPKQSASRGFVNLANKNYIKPIGTLVSKGQQVRSKSDLSEILANEIAAEASTDDVDQEYLDAKKSVEKAFKIIDEDGKGVVTLERKHKDETITVVFDCQDEEELEMSEEAMERSMKGEEVEDELSTGINFTATIDKGGNKMIVSCTAGEDVQINEVRYAPSGKDTQDEELYAGPIFHELDEQLVESFYDYLADRKIDQDLSFFIIAHSQHKEQKEYVNWLNKLLDFTSK